MGRNFHDLVRETSQILQLKSGRRGKYHLHRGWETLEKELLEEGWVERQRALSKKALHVPEQFRRASVSEVFRRQQFLEAPSLGGCGAFQDCGFQHIVGITGGRGGKHVYDLCRNFLRKDAYHMPELRKLRRNISKCKLALHLEKPYGRVLAPERGQANGEVVQRGWGGSFCGAGLSWIVGWGRRHVRCECPGHQI